MRPDLGTGYLHRFVLRDTVAGPEFVEYLETYKSPKRLLDDLLVGQPGTLRSGVHLGQELLVDAHGGSPVHHLILTLHSSERLSRRGFVLLARIDVPLLDSSGTPPLWGAPSAPSRSPAAQP